MTKKQQLVEQLDLDITAADVAFTKLEALSPKLAALQNTINSVVTKLDKRLRKVKPISEYVHDEPFYKEFYLMISLGRRGRRRFRIWSKTGFEGADFSDDHIQHHCSISHLDLAGASTMVQMAALKHVAPLLQEAVRGTEAALAQIEGSLLEGEHCPLCGGESC